MGNRRIVDFSNAMTKARFFLFPVLGSITNSSDATQRDLTIVVKAQLVPKCRVCHAIPDDVPLRGYPHWIHFLEYGAIPY